jgi:hypothetical protein
LKINDLGTDTQRATITGMRLVRALAALLVIFSGGAPLRAADRVDPLERARLLYNQGEYDAAVAAAEEGRRVPDKADSADLIAARAFLEKFRQSGITGDLSTGRDRLRRINASRLNPAERSEFTVGLGVTLYFDGDAGAAGELFDSVLADSQLTTEARERVLDWWASALDEEARKRSDADRASTYQRVRDRMRAELASNDGSVAASYWLAAAARGQGDLQAAWDAAQAGWVRSTLSAGRGDALRQDLDRLVLQALVPERARALDLPAEDLTLDWEKFKERW